MLDDSPESAKGRPAASSSGSKTEKEKPKRASSPKISERYISTTGSRIFTEAEKEQYAKKRKRHDDPLHYSLRVFRIFFKIQHNCATKKTFSSFFLYFVGRFRPE